MNPKKKKNWIGNFLVVFFVLVIVASLTTETKIFNPTVEKELITIEAENVETVDAATDVFTLKLENIDESNNTLLFYTNHQEVHAYVEDELIYALEKDETIFGGTPGAKWNIISIPLDAKELKIEVTQIYTGLAKQDVEFQLGNAIDIERDVVKDSIIDVLICLTILLTGVGLVVFWRAVFRKTNIHREIFYLGMFAIIFGTWAFGETKLAVFMFENRAFWSYMAFTCLMTMCLPFLYFVREFLETEDKLIHKLIAGYIIFETIVAQILHFTGIRSVKETVLFTMASIVIIVLYLLYGIVMAIKNKKSKRKIRANVAGLLVLLVVMAADMGGYFVDVANTNQLGKLGFLIYAVLLGVEAARTAGEQMQESHKAAIYKEMAEKDMPTGCYNRNAYSQDTSVGTELTGVQIITFDLNNLKVCNDTLGHMAGDKYIADAASMIQDVFKGFGKVYRIGGDEFCILAKGVSEEKIIEKRNILAEQIKVYRTQNTHDGFGIACGYATYDPEIDKDIEETRHRADLLMYENKKEIKALS